MNLVILLAALAVVGAVPLLWWSVAGAHTPARNASRKLLQGGPAVPDIRNAVLQQSAADRAVKPFVEAVAGASRRLLPVSWAEGLERRLVLAGRPAAWPLQRVFAAKLLLAAVAVIPVVIYLTGDPSTVGILVSVGVVALAYFTPDLLLYSRATERQAAMRLALPDTLDQMTISVEAGLGFESAMQRAAENGSGALADELVRTLQEIQVGVGRSRALRNLADRTDVPDLRHFVLAVIQAEGYGIPIADVLRVQAGELRVKRRQRAEERAMKIPVKVVFPLVLCILPTLFIVAMGPGMIRMSRTLFGAGGAL